MVTHLCMLVSTTLDKTQVSHFPEYWAMHENMIFILEQSHLKFCARDDSNIS